MNPKQHLLALLFTVFVAPGFAQNTGGFNYQAVLRHNDFTPYSNQNIQVFLNILNAPSSGTLLFSESHANIQTDVLGQFNLVIGQGTPTFNLFSDIDWASGPRFLDVVVNLNGNFTSLGITQFISVPFAKVAEKSLFSGPPSGAATLDLSGNYPGPTVVGLQNRAVSDAPPMPGNVLKWNSSTSKWEPSTDLQGGGGSNYSAGIGIGISPTNVISNTGDLDATDDLTINSQAGGDLNGPFSNLKLKNDVVGSAQIINGSIQPADLAFSLPTIPATLPPSGAASGDLAGSYPAPTIANLQGQPLDVLTGSANGRVLKFLNGKWQPADDNGGTGGDNWGTQTAVVGTGLSGNGTPGSPLVNTGDTNSSDDLLKNDPTGGDISGIFSNVSVNKLKGVAISATPPTGGNVLKFNSSTSQWEPADDNGGTGGDNWGTQTAVVGTGLSGNGTPGSPLVNTGDTNSSDDLLKNDPTGGDISGIFSNVSVNKLKGVAISASPPTGGKVLKFNSSTSQWEPADDNGGTGGDNWGTQTAVVGTGLSGNGTSGSPLVNTGDTNSSDDLLKNDPTGGDISGIFSNVSVNKLKGVAISATLPTGGKVLKFNSSTSQWEPADDNGGTGGDNWGTQTAVVGTGLSGNGTSGSPLTNTGDTNSSDDLTTSSTAGGDANGPFSNLQITVGTAEVSDGSLTAADLAAGVIPTSLPPNGAAGGDLSGSFPNPTVDGLQGKAVSPTAPTDGLVLKFSSANNQWQPDTDNIGSGGTLSGEVTGPSGNNIVARLKGRKIGGMPPNPNQMLMLNYSNELRFYESDVRLDKDEVTNDTALILSKLKGRKIGGMPPNPNQMMIFNGANNELEFKSADLELQNGEIQLASIQGNPVDLNGAGPGMALTCVNGANGLEFRCVVPASGFSLPYSETGSFNAPMLDLKNTNSGTQNGVRFDNTGRYGVRAISREGQASFNFDAATVNAAFTYPAAVFGEQINTGLSGVGVFGKAVSSVNDQEGNGVIGLGKSNGVLGMVIGNNGRAGVTGVAIAPATVGGRFIGHITLQNGQFQFVNNVVSDGDLNVIERTGNGIIEVGGDWTSNVNGMDNLGSSTKRWNTVFATNGTINTSDAREKQAIEPVNYGLAEVMKLRPVSFEWKSSPETGRKLGFIAQDLQPILPETVSDREWSRDENNRLTAKPAERLGVFYSDIIPVLARAIQEQQAMIQKKDVELEAIKSKLESLEMRLERLEKSGKK